MVRKIIFEQGSSYNTLEDLKFANQKYAVSSVNSESAIDKFVELQYINMLFT